MLLDSLILHDQMSEFIDSLALMLNEDREGVHFTESASDGLGQKGREVRISGKQEKGRSIKSWFCLGE